MRTMKHVVTDLQHAGYIWQVLRFETLAQFIDRVEHEDLTYLNEWIDRAIDTFNYLIAEHALCLDDQLIVTEWIVSCQIRGEKAMKARVVHA